jgi:hypothetical protein
MLKSFEEKIRFSNKLFYQDVDLNDWTSDGCYLVSTNSSHSQCECNRMATFALMQVGSIFDLELTPCFKKLSFCLVLHSINPFKVAFNQHRFTQRKNVLRICLLTDR